TSVRLWPCTVMPALTRSPTVTSPNVGTEIGVTCGFVGGLPASRVIVLFRSVSMQGWNFEPLMAATSFRYDASSLRILASDPTEVTGEPMLKSLPLTSAVCADSPARPAQLASSWLSALSSGVLAEAGV